MTTKYVKIPASVAKTVGIKADKVGKVKFPKVVFIVVSYTNPMQFDKFDNLNIIDKYEFKKLQDKNTADYVCKSAKREIQLNLSEIDSFKAIPGAMHTIYAYSSFKEALAQAKVVLKKLQDYVDDIKIKSGKLIKKQSTLISKL